jgi:hypothetical protein
VLGALKRLRIWQKLAIMGLTFIIGLTVATSLLLAEKQRALRSTERERDGITYLLPLKTLLSEVSVHKILQHRLLREDAGVESRTRELERTIDGTFTEIERLDERLGHALGTTESALKASDRADGLPSALKDEWEGVRDQMDVKASDDIHDQLIHGIRELIAQVGDTSDLVFDQQRGAFYTMDVLLRREPHIFPTLADLNIRVFNGLHGDPTVDVDRAQLASAATQLDTDAADLRADLLAAFSGSREGKRASGFQSTLSPLLDGAVQKLNVVRNFTRRTSSTLRSRRSTSLDTPP